MQIYCICAREKCWYTNTWLDIGMNIFIAFEGIGVDVIQILGMIVR